VSVGGYRYVRLVESTWENRDLPVLRAVVTVYDETTRPVSVAELSAATGLEAVAVGRALIALSDEDPPFFVPVDGSTLAGRQIDAASQPTGYARRTVGAWPTPEALTDRIVAVLNQAAEDETDEANKSKLKTAAIVVGGVARDLVIGVASGAIANSAGM